MDISTKVLVVDDFSTMRRIVKGALRKLGFKEIIEASDGVEALKVIQSTNIGLILADWNMPKMNGLELLQAVQKDKNFKNIPFIMVTAEGQKDNILNAVRAGVSDYVVKPFSQDVLEEKVIKALS